MRITLATHTFPPDSFGGTEQYTLALARHLQDAGHDVSILTYAPGDTREVVARDDAYDGIPVRRLSFDLDRTQDPVREEYDNARVAAYLRGEWGRRAPDLLHVTHLGNLSTATLQVARESAIATMVTLTDMWALCPVGTLIKYDGCLCSGPTDLGDCARCLTRMGPRGRRYARVTERVPGAAWRAAAWLGQRQILRRVSPVGWIASLKERTDLIRERILLADAISSPGRFLRDLLHHFGYPSERIHVMPHGIERPERLRPRSRSVDHETLRIGYVGPLQPHKGAHLAIDAFTLLESVDDVTLTYWGSIPSTPDAYAQQVLDRIQATPGAEHRGPYSHDQVGEVMSQIDILLMPSLCYENTPTILYEAFASGTPVIATDAGGMRELVDEYRGGWLVPRADVAALATLMTRLARDRGEIESLAAGIHQVPNLSDHAASLEQVYRQALDAESK